MEILPLIPEKSENDKKSYRLLKLKNELNVLLVSDPFRNQNQQNKYNEMLNRQTSVTSTENEAFGESKEKLAGCCLNISVGSFSDPKNAQGLAHFVEHMIFMGSEKYPAENELSEFLSKHGSYLNAHTDLDETAFYLDVQERYFDKALDIFSSLFKAPLMLKEAMTREREAVDSEFTSSKYDDTFRHEQCLAAMGESDHPYNGFACGNLITLKNNLDDQELHAKAHEFRRRHYSAHRMHLCLQARMSLDELQELAIKHFSDIPNNQLPPDDFSAYTHENAYTDRFYKNLLFMKPIKNTSNVNIVCYLPPTQKDYKSRPESYVSTLLEHEGKGSLLNFLRKKLWADMLSGEVSRNSLLLKFDVNISLTEKGFEHIDEVIEAVFSYLRFLKQIGPDERVYREIQSIACTSFRFAVEEDALSLVVNLASKMREYPAEHIITANQLYMEYDPNAIEEVIDNLNAGKFNISIISKRLYDDQVKFDSKEKWYGTEYCEREMLDKWIDMWNNVQPFEDFHLPEPNPYIADDFTLFYDTTKIVPKYPIKIFENEVCELWHRQDDKFLLPHASFNFYFMSSIIKQSVKNTVLMNIYSTILNHHLVSDLSSATQANLRYNFVDYGLGALLWAGGYNQKLYLIIDAFVKSMKTMSHDTIEEEFKVFVEQEIKQQTNLFILPADLACHLNGYVFEDQEAFLIDKLNALKALQFQDFQEFCHEFLKEMRVKALIQGNITEDAALTVMENMLSGLDCDQVKDRNAIEIYATKIPEGNAYFRCTALNVNNVNTIISNFYQIGPATLQNKILTDLLVQIANEPFFDVLRTKEQLAYSLIFDLHENIDSIGYTMLFNTQEIKFSAEYIDDRAENFRQELISIIENLSEKNFEKFKMALIKLIIIEDSELETETRRNWDEITKNAYIFDRAEKEVEALKTITKEELLGFYLKYLNNENRKLSIQIIGNANGDVDGTVDETIMKKCRSIENLSIVDFSTPKPDAYLIRDIVEYKKSLELYPKITNAEN